MNSRYLPEWLTLLAEHGGGKVALVPGGGIFADLVRRAQTKWHFDDNTAHQMAIRAMEQYGLMLLSLESRLCPANSIKAIKDAIKYGKVPIWFPYDMIATNHNIPASWEYTSDSLSLWIAKQLNSEHLVLVKSVKPKQDHCSIEELARYGMLDKGFVNLIISTKLQLWWLFHDQFPVFHNMLRKNELPECFKIAIQHVKKNDTNIDRQTAC